MIGTMNNQQVQFANTMQEFALSYETDLRFSSTRLDVYLCHDGVSYPPLESGLDEKFDHPLTPPSLVARFSLSTLKNNTTFVMTLLIHLSLQLSRRSSR